MSFRGRTVVMLVIASIAISSLVTALFLNPSNPIETLTTSLADQESKSFVENQEKLLQVYHAIKKNYIRKIDDQALMNGAIKGMVEAMGDPYSEYMNPKEAKQFHTDLESSFTGIGAGVILDHGQVTIYSIMKGSPSEKAGLKIDDQILKVDGHSLEGLSLQDAVSKIRGPKGSKVTLEILRGDQTFTITVVRDEISVETVTGKMLQNKTGYISITQFAEKTDQEFFETLASLEKQEMKGLVIDVRNNPGGILPVVLKIAEAFIPDGKPIMTTEDKAGNRTTYKGKAKQKKPYPISILTNKGSASASEILAAAFQEAGGYQVIGETSYGKGSVQTAMDLDDGSNLKLTVSKWLTPNGNWIDKHGGTKGIKPDIAVNPPQYTQYQIPQIQKTLHQDDNSPEIAKMQKILEALGYQPGRTDGYFDEKTVSALQTFQKQYGISSSGSLDQSTVEQLANAYRKFLQDPKHDKQLQVAIQAVQKKQNE